MNSVSEPRQLTSAQKAGFVSLLIFALLTISFSFLQLRNTVYGRFTIHKPAEEVALDVSKYDETVKLQQIDTDHDELNDYEELYNYNTSPYLPDTDGDKISDKTEINQGTNPLCPEGKVCAESEFGSGVASSSTPASPLFGNIGTPEDILVGSQLNATTTLDQTSLLSLIQNPTQLREVILATGKISKEELNKIDDATLIELAKKLAQEYAGGAPQSGQSQ